MPDQAADLGAGASQVADGVASASAATAEDGEELASGAGELSGALADGTAEIRGSLTASSPTSATDSPRSS